MDELLLLLAGGCDLLFSSPPNLSLPFADSRYIDWRERKVRKVARRGGYLFLIFFSL